MDEKEVSAKSDTSETDFIHEILKEICEDSSDSHFASNFESSYSPSTNQNIVDQSDSKEIFQSECFYSSSMKTNEAYDSLQSNRMSIFKSNNTSPSYMNSYFRHSKNYFNICNNEYQYTCPVVSRDSPLLPHTYTSNYFMSEGSLFSECAQPETQCSNAASFDTCWGNHDYYSSLRQNKYQLTDQWTLNKSFHLIPQHSHQRSSLEASYFNAVTSFNNQCYNNLSSTMVQQKSSVYNSPTMSASSTPSPSHWGKGTPYTFSLSNNSINSSQNFTSQKRTKNLDVNTQEFDIDEIATPNIREQKSSARKRKDRKMQLWEFILNLLRDPLNESVEWVDQIEGLFRVTCQNNLVEKWSIYRNRGHMNFEKLTRTIRFYYPKGFLTKIQGKQNLYKFNYNKLPPLTKSQSDSNV